MIGGWVSRQAMAAITTFDWLAGSRCGKQLNLVIIIVALSNRKSLNFF